MVVQAWAAVPHAGEERQTNRLVLRLRRKRRRRPRPTEQDGVGDLFQQVPDV
jgi:hypothetical protein